MAKRRKSRHRAPPGGLEMRSDPISERYQTEVDYATSRLERRFQRALKARDAAIAKLNAATNLVGRRPSKASQLAELRRRVDIREYELAEVVKLMQPGNRARVDWRPVPVTLGMPL